MLSPDRVVDPARIDILLHTALGDQRIVGIFFEQAVLMVQAHLIIPFKTYDDMLFIGKEERGSRSTDFLFFRQTWAIRSQSRIFLELLACCAMAACAFSGC